MTNIPNVLALYPHTIRSTINGGAQLMVVIDEVYGTRKALNALPLFVSFVDRPGRYMIRDVRDNGDHTFALTLDLCGDFDELVEWIHSEAEREAERVRMNAQIDVSWIEQAERKWGEMWAKG